MMIHRALPYESDDAYASAVGSFVQDGIRAGEPVLVMAPAERLDLLRQADWTLRGAHTEDMATAGRNPACIIPALMEFLDRSPGRPARVVQEATWVERDSHEMAEAARHEALMNLALAGYDVTLLCPYVPANLSPAFADMPWCTHPEMLSNGSRQRSERYESPLDFADSSRWPLSPPEPLNSPMDLDFTELGPVRRFMEKVGAVAGLPDDRLDDAVLVVNELASNSLVHGGGEGTVTSWMEDRALMCEVADRGHITDPLVGRFPPGPALEARGLWLVNHLSDLVELRTGPAGTRVRVTFRLAG